MSLELILKDYLNQPKIELGDRTEYVGASDVGQCPRKVVLSKTQPVPHDLQRETFA
jgi:CRISPR-associated exonuclease Cas4